MERCSAITLASAMLGMHSMRPSSGEVASTLRTARQPSLRRTRQVKVSLHRCPAMRWHVFLIGMSHKANMFIIILTQHAVSSTGCT